MYDTQPTRIAIDPGMSGGITVKTTRRTMVFHYTSLDEAASIITAQPRAAGVKIALELVQSMPGAATNKLTLAYGFFLGVAEAIGATVINVRPQQWQRAVLTDADGLADKPQLLGYEEYAIGGEDERIYRQKWRAQNRSHVKACSMRAALRLFPQFKHELTPERNVRTKEDIKNMSDSLCIFHYAYNMVKKDV